VAPFDYDARLADERTGEISSPNYALFDGVGAGLRSSAEVIADADPFSGDGYNIIQALDVAVSRSGRYTFTLWAVNDPVGGQFFVFFIAYDNATGLEIDRKTIQNVAGTIGTVRGNICVIDDSTGESAPDLLYDDCLVAVQTTDVAAVLTYTDLAKLSFGGSPPWTHSSLVSLSWATGAAAEAWAGVQVNNRGVGTTEVHFAYRNDPATNNEIIENIRSPANAFLEFRFPYLGFDLDWTVTPVMVQRKRNPGTADNRVFYAVILVGFPTAIELSSTVFGTTFRPGTGPNTIPTAVIVRRIEVDALNPFSAIAGYTFPVFLAYTESDVGVNNVKGHLVGTGAGEVASAVVNIALGADPSAIRQLGCRQLRLINADPFDVVAPPRVARVAVCSTEPDAGTGQVTKKFYTEIDIRDDAATFIVNPRDTTPTVKNTDLNTLVPTNRDFHFDVARFNAATSVDNENDFQALAYELNGQSEGRLRTAAPIVALMVEWNAREYERCTAAFRTNALNLVLNARGIGQDASGVNPGVKVRTLSTPGGAELFDYSFSTLLLDGVNFIDGGYSVESNSGAAAPTVKETGAARIWPVDGVSDGLINADVSETGLIHIKNITWLGPGDPLVVDPVSGTGKLTVGHTIRILDPSNLAGRYSIEAFVRDVNGVVTDLQLSPPPPVATAAGPIDIVAYVSAAPSDSIRQLLLPPTEPNLIAHSNAIHPAVIDANTYILQTDAVDAPVARINVPFQNFQVPSIASVTFKVFDPSLSPSFPNFPPTSANRMSIKLVPNVGPSSEEKGISTEANSTQFGGGGTATVFGFQSFNDETLYGPGPGAFPAGINGVHRGDFLIVVSGPNKGTYVIQDLFTDPSAPKRILVDRPFPVQGGAGNPAWVIVTARATPMEGGFTLYSMSFDLAAAGIDPSATDMDLLATFYDEVLNGPVTYEVDTIAVQWS
jgi:hypothetical protein